MSSLEQQDAPGSSLVPGDDVGMAGEEYQEDYGQAGGEGEEEWDAELDQELAGLSEQVEEAEKANAKIQETVNSTKADADEITAEKTRKEEEKKERDARSVFVMNVHFDAKGEQVAEFFAPCGPIVSATIVENKQGQAKGYAYIEFAKQSSVDNALILSGTTFMDREITVSRKRTNVPSFMLGRGGRGGGGGGGGRGGGERGGRARGRGRGMPGMFGMPFGYMPMPYMHPGMFGMGGRGGGRGGRGRGGPRGGRGGRGT